MTALLARLAKRQAGQSKPISDRLWVELKIARGANPTIAKMDRIGQRSAFTCPDCAGVMWEIDEGDLVRFRCHIGKAYTRDLMGPALDESPVSGLGDCGACAGGQSGAGRQAPA